MAVHRVLVPLSKDDADLLNRLADELGISRCEVMRYAIRYYALMEPWDDSESLERTGVLGGRKEVNYAPGRRQIV